MYVALELWQRLPQRRIPACGPRGVHVRTFHGRADDKQGWCQLGGLARTGIGQTIQQYVNVVGYTSPGIVVVNVICKYIFVFS